MFSSRKLDWAEIELVGVVNMMDRKVSVQEDEEFEMLLGEIPRATSAPPHGRSVGSSKDEAEGESVLSGDFYAVSSGSLSYYGGSVSSSDSRNSSQLLLDQKSSPLKVEEQHVAKSGVSLPAQQHIFPDLGVNQNGVEHALLDDQSLAAVFGNLNFKETRNGDGNSGDSRQVNLVDNVNGGIEMQNGHSYSAGNYSAFDVMKTTLPMHLNVDVNSFSSPRTVSYGIDQSSQSNHHRNGDVQRVGNGILPLTETQTMKQVLKQNAYHTDTYMNGFGLPFKTSSLGSLDFQQSFPVNSVATPPVPGIQGYQFLANPSMSLGSNLQQHYYFDPSIGPFMQPQSCQPSVSDLHQQVNRMQPSSWQRMKEEGGFRTQQEYMLLQQTHGQALAALPNQVGAAFVGDSSNRTVRQHGLYSSVPGVVQFKPPLGSTQLQGEVFNGRDWVASPVHGMLGSCNQLEGSVQSGNICRYHAQGFCSRGENCPFYHGQIQRVVNGRTLKPSSVPFKDPQMGGILECEQKPAFPEKILTRNRSRGINSITTINPVPSGSEKEASSNGQCNAKTLPNGHLLSEPFNLDIHGHYRSISPQITESEIPLRSLVTSQQQLKYTSLDEIKGQIYSTAMDQNGCRFLQRKFDEGSPEDVEKIFLEIIDHIIELMTDQFGNYLVQKLLEVCTEDQRMRILHAVTKETGELVNISLNTHGTRAVQKLVEIIKTPQEVSMVVSSLKPGVVTLIKDSNGNHVVQRCLQRLHSADNQFLFDAAVEHCIEIATHKHGCCVLQRCIDYSIGAQQQRLVAEIAANAFSLSQDAYGNYVVQYILALEMPWVIEDVINHLESKYAILSMQKYSSNVIETCLKNSGDEGCGRIIRELVNSSLFGQLLQDPFANYVIQCALKESKGSLHSTLVDAIRPHLPTLRISPFGKRILSRNNLKK